jgi:TolB-like protein/Tfp pilus assembly protein PilF/tRNA A-37 threonylcarbamoyl transferase component Bud32
MVAAGTRFGPYEVLSLVGAGGMGEVYRARDTRLDRDVAIKVLPERLARDPDRLARFERETKAVASLAHPNIVVLHDLCVQEGSICAVTELLQGETLRDRLARSALPWRAAVELAAGMADGLAAAHAKGIIHRDIKPENIFITSDGQVKILDFGVARFQEDVPSSSSTPTVVDAPGQTDPGRILGTIAYMSPEQVRAQPVDARSDIFSLGCVLYEMLTARRPFLRDSTADTMAAILTEELPELPESARAPIELDRIIRRCLEKNREARFQSASDLAFALRALATSTHSSGIIGVRVDRAAQTKPGHLGLVFVLIVAAIGVVAGTLYMRSRPNTTETRPAATLEAAIDAVAVLPFINATGDAANDYLSDGIADGLSHALSQVHVLKVRPSATVSRFRGHDIDIAEVGRTLQVQAVVTGRFQKRGAQGTVSLELIDTRDNSQMWGIEYNREFANLLPLPNDIALAIAERLRPALAADDKQRLKKRFTDNPEANQLYMLGRYYWNKRTMDGMQQAVRYFQKAIERDPKYALAHAGLADCYVVLTWFNPEPPARIYRDARASAVRALQLDDNLAEANADLAFVSAYCDWDWSGADRTFRRAIELNPNCATSHQWYGRFLSSIGRHAQAIDEVRTAQKLDPSSLIINANLAGALLYAGQTDEALRQALATVQLDPHFPIGHIWLGNIYAVMGKYQEAILAFEKAGEHYSPPKLVASLAWLHGLSGNKTKAKQMLEELKRSAGNQYLSPAALAGIYVGLGDMDEAFRLLQDAANDRDPWLIDIRVDQMYAPLRGDPRYSELLKRMHFPD